MKFIGVREFKQDAVKYLNEGNEIVVMKRKKPIARLTPVHENTPAALLLEIGRVLNEAAVSAKGTPVEATAQRRLKTLKGGTR